MNIATASGSRSTSNVPIACPRRRASTIARRSLVTNASTRARVVSSCAASSVHVFAHEAAAAAHHLILAVESSHSDELAERVDRVREFEEKTVEALDGLFSVRVEGLDQQTMLVAERPVETAALQTSRLDEIFHRRRPVPLPPEHLHRSVDNRSLVELARPRHSGILPVLERSVKNSERLIHCASAFSHRDRWVGPRSPRMWRVVAAFGAGTGDHRRPIACGPWTTSGPSANQAKSSRLAFARSSTISGICRHRARNGTCAS